MRIRRDLSRIAAWHRGILRDGAWLAADRVQAASWLMFAALLALVATIPWTVPHLALGYDFATLRDAARLALAGQAAEAYGRTCQDVMAAVQGPGEHLPFFYPPTALFLGLPFAAMPLVPALGLWLGVTGVAYVMVLRAIVGRGAVGPAIGFPAVFTCALLGQNSLLSAALFGGAALTLDRAPRAAGLLLGCLAYKPQLAVLAPLALALAGRWRAFGAATLTVLALVLGSVVAFGLDSWTQFFTSLGVMNRCLGAGENFAIFASVYGAVRLVHGSGAAAWLWQMAAAVAAAVVIGVVAWRRPGGTAEIAALTVASLFCVPFLGDYDLVVAAVAGAWIGGEARRTGWLSYERVLLGLLFMAPLLIKSMAGTFAVPLAPVALALLGWMVWRRAMRPAGVARGPG